MKYDCLIVDDEQALSQSTSEYFNMFDVRAAWVDSADACRAFLKENDVNLGGDSGFVLCKELRETTNIPILFISARGGDDDVLLALNIGGDDYITKPYSLNILLAKVKAVLKRTEGGAAAQPITFGAFKLDLAAGRLYKNGEPVPLKTMEYKLLSYLAQSRGRVVPKEEIFERVWGDTITSDGTLNVHIRHLREKIEEDPGDPVFITTVWGTGYLFS
ncbi:MAG: response regulator transcription factor [Clostridiales Family XIII bacterium]|jgi:two-component system response regulator RegX3|nr:response regulator transcription factor [Clostridiales Family XIII bacterium]